MSESYEELAKSMHDKAVELDAHLTNIKTLNNELRSRIEKIVEALNTLVGDKKTTCNYCYTRKPTHALMPCGHFGYCESCAQRAFDRSRCFTCRSAITSIAKIYV